MEAPIHTATFGAGTLRFFRPQRGGPDFPWLDYTALLHCLGVQRGFRRHLLKQCKEGPFKSDFLTVETTAGPALLAPHYAAQGTVDGMVDLGEIPAAIRMQYLLAGSEACGIVTAGKSKEELAEYLAAALRRNDVGFATKIH